MIEKIAINQWLKTFRSMIEAVYKEDNTFKNNKEGLFNLVCNPKLSFYQKSQQEMIAVKKNGVIQCFCVLICHRARPEVLCISFFEALENTHDAVDEMISYAEAFGRKIGCLSMIIGLEGHCNYGLGFLIEERDKKTVSPSFGEAYSPNYYQHLLKNYGAHKYHSFWDPTELIEERVDVLMKRFGKAKEKYLIEQGTFIGKGFIETMRRYTDLNNLIFEGHTSYYHRDYIEDIELFRSMVPLLNPDNLLFIQKNGLDIGFILWYPDFNELVPMHKGAGILTFIKYRLLMQRPKTLKIVEIGINPKYRSSPAILFLFNAVVEASKLKKTLFFRRHKYTKLISSWIDENNILSSSVTQKFASQKYKEFVTYEKTL